MPAGIGSGGCEASGAVTGAEIEGEEEGEEAVTEEAALSNAGLSVGPASPEPPPQATMARTDKPQAAKTAGVREMRRRERRVIVCGPPRHGATAVEIGKTQFHHRCCIRAMSKAQESRSKRCPCGKSHFLM
jgi:hypothetical protein